jgi:hypothetical protein
LQWRVAEWDYDVATWMKNGGDEMTKATRALYDQAFK